jgi:peroxiredoxin
MNSSRAAGPSLPAAIKPQPRPCAVRDGQNRTARLLIALVVISLTVPLSGQAVQIGSPAPMFALPDPTGSIFSFSDYRGKVLLITFWAPWCSSCREELAALEGLFRRYRKDGLEVLAVSVDSSKQSVSSVIGKMHATYTVLLDDQQRVSDAYQCTHLPTTVIVGRDGLVKKIIKGYSKDSLRTYEQVIIELLKQK